MNGLSKQKQKYIQSLHNKKYRKQYEAFLVEGEKSVKELLASDFEILELYLSEKALQELPEVSNYSLCFLADLEKVSTFRSNNFGLAVVKMKENKPIVTNQGQWTLALDDINDPGNLGTIIRIADWYGIKEIICSVNTVELYNPKVISSTMGSFTRVSCYYTDLGLYLKHSTNPVYGAVLQGSNIHELDRIEPGVLVIGSESHGIASEIVPFLNQKLTIPAFGKAESLNAGVATGILLDNLIRLSS